MERWFVFLRAVNVGGRTVKMDALRLIFEELGLTGVETYIASGNVVFNAPDETPAALEQRIARRLGGALGFETAVFARTAAELTAITTFEPFAPERLAAAGAFNIAFLASVPGQAAIEKLMGLRSAQDDFNVAGREVYWLCQVKQSQSTFSNALLEKTLGQPSTMRGVNTIRKMAARYA